MSNKNKRSEEQATKTSELKPCPFCGGRAAMNQDNEGYYVSCCEEGCVVMINSYAEKEAAEKWNTRKPIEEIVEKLEEVSFPDVDETYADDGQRMLFLYDAIEIVKEVANE